MNGALFTDSENCNYFQPCGSHENQHLNDKVQLNLYLNYKNKYRILNTNKKYEYEYVFFFTKTQLFRRNVGNL